MVEVEVKVEVEAEVRVNEVDIIIAMLRKDPAITIAELQRRLKFTKREVEWRLKRLKEKGVLKRVGSDKSGHWEVADVASVKNKE